MPRGLTIQSGTHLGCLLKGLIEEVGTFPHTVLENIKAPGISVHDNCHLVAILLTDQFQQCHPCLGEAVHQGLLVSDSLPQHLRVNTAILNYCLFTARKMLSPPPLIYEQRIVISIVHLLPIHVLVKCSVVILWTAVECKVLFIDVSEIKK